MTKFKLAELTSERVSRFNDNELAAGDEHDIDRAVAEIAAANRELDAKTIEHDEAATVERLASLSALKYAKARAEAARALGIPVTSLDEAVKEARTANSNSKRQLLFPHWNVEPSASPVEAQSLLSTIIARIERHVSMNPDAALTAALIVMMTWVHERAAIHSPMLLVTSPEANSGKSTLLGVISFMVRRPLPTVGITAAALYRSIAKWQPTIIVDEADTAFVDNEDLPLSAIDSNNLQLAAVRLIKPSGITGSASASDAPLSLAQRNKRRRSSANSSSSIC
jgi:putative DNA primase/helicase